MASYESFGHHLGLFFAFVQPDDVTTAALAGLPSVAAPVGRTRAGLPVGAQIVGPMYEDDTAITFAELLADVVGGYECPPI